jgi:hypothetical protein
MDGHVRPPRILESQSSRRGINQSTRRPLRSPVWYKRTELLLAGHSQQEVIATIKATIDKKELPALEQGTVSYRMSKDSYLGDYGGPNAPHMMFFETAKDDLNPPRISDKNLGRKLEGDYR